MAEDCFQAAKIECPLSGGELEGINFGCRPIPDLATAPPLKMIFFARFPVSSHWIDGTDFSRRIGSSAANPVIGDAVSMRFE